MLIYSFHHTLIYSRFGSATKKIFYPLLTIAMLLVILGGCGTDIAGNLDKEIEKNEQLTEEITELKGSNANLKEKYDESENHIDDLTSITTDLKGEKNKLQNEIEAFSVEVDALKEENKQLQTELKEREAASKNTSPISQTTPQKSNSSTPNSSSKASDAVEDCVIKGSVNGIYHTPGSTYYSLTKNVVQWFCSEKEAQNAGYRAPKR